MLKIPRFMKEYASYMRRKLEENPLLHEKTKKEWLSGIDDALSLYKQGFISVWEAMSKIGSGEYIA